MLTLIPTFWRRWECITQVVWLPRNHYIVHRISPCGCPYSCPLCIYLSVSLNLSIFHSLSVYVCQCDIARKIEYEMCVKSVSAIIFQGRKEKNNLQCKCFQFKKRICYTTLTHFKYISLCLCMRLCLLESCNKLCFIECKFLIQNADKVKGTF